MTASEQRADDDGGTILEPIGHLAQVLSEHGASPHGSPPPRVTMSQQVPKFAAPLPPAPTEQDYRPTIRPPVPLLTILDDGEASTGETVRLRDQVSLIGRSEGLIKLPHDPLVSACHAEIVREGVSKPFRWILRDVGSSNGTFVKCIGTALRPDRLLILGSRRFRFHRPPSHAPQSNEGTFIMDSKEALAQAWPMLIETTAAKDPLRLLLPGTCLSVGRPGHGNQVEIDDPLLAKFHAQILMTSTGEWRIEAKPSNNGIWAQIGSIRLTNTCRFQCGEQRFLFVS